MPNFSRSTFTYRGAANREARGTLRLPAGRPAPVVFLCHGFKGFMEWGFFPYLADRLAESGFATVAFDFTHNGIGSHPQQLTELDAFKANRFSFEVEDIISVYRWLEASAHLHDIDLGSIALVGHSRGGAAVLNAAAAGLPGLSKIVTLAAISRYPAVTAEEERSWRETGTHFVENRRTGQLLPLGLPLLDEIRNRPHELEVNCRKIVQPVLLIHGSADQSVPASCASELHGWLARSSVHLIQGADHAFGAVHPFRGTTEALEEAIGATKDFLRAGSPPA